MSADCALAVDIGGTKLDVGLVDIAGRILVRSSTATALARDEGTGGRDPDDRLFGLVADLVDKVLGSSPSGVDAVVCGVGCGGPMSAGGDDVSPLNIPEWRGFPLKARLASLTGLSTFVDNDAKALALAEGWVGAAKGERNYVGMVVSTGVGGGLVVDGRLLDGATGNAGHIGHVIVEPDGRPCACGGRGCLEALISGPSIAAWSGRPPEQADATVIERAGVLLGRAVASTVALLDVRVVCVAGSVALGFGTPFFAAAQAELERSAALEYCRGARIVPAGLGSDGPLIGAAAVGFRGIGRPLS